MIFALKNYMISRSLFSFQQLPFYRPSISHYSTSTFKTQYPTVNSINDSSKQNSTSLINNKKHQFYTNVSYISLLMSGVYFCYSLNESILDSRLEVAALRREQRSNKILLDKIQVEQTQLNEKLLSYNQKQQVNNELNKNQENFFIQKSPVSNLLKDQQISSNNVHYDITYEADAIKLRILEKPSQPQQSQQQQQQILQTNRNPSGIQNKVIFSLNSPTVLAPPSSIITQNQSTTLQQSSTVPSTSLNTPANTVSQTPSQTKTTNTATISTQTQ